MVTFIKEIVKDVKLLDPEIKCIHYWTDSPTSQYRNKTIFHLVANHQETFGIDAKWNSFFKQDTVKVRVMGLVDQPNV